MSRRIPTMRTKKTVFEEEVAGDSGLARAMATCRVFHDMAKGRPCLICGEKCSGFDMHVWRKVCRSCKCGPMAHDTSDLNLDAMSATKAVGKLSKELTQKASWSRPG